MLRRIALALYSAVLLCCAPVAHAITCSPYPFVLTNGTTADANQVMSDFNAAATCISQITSTMNTFTVTQTFSAATTFSAAVTFPGSTQISAAGKLGVGMTPTNIVDITQNQNAFSNISILNNNAGAVAQSGISATNGTHSGSLSQSGVSFTPSGIFLADQTVLFAAGGTGGLLVGTSTTKPIYFGINGALAHEIDANSHQIIKGPTPTCGGGCSSFQFGNDNAFVVVGTNPTASVSVNFGQTWSSSPVCEATSNTAGFTFTIGTTASLVNISLSASVASPTFYVRCIATS